MYIGKRGHSFSMKIPGSIRSRLAGRRVDSNAPRVPRFRASIVALLHRALISQLNSIPALIPERFDGRNESSRARTRKTIATGRGR